VNETRPPAAGAEGRRPEKEEKPPPRLLGLDALRFIAAAGVLLYHYTARWSQVWGEPPEDVFPLFGQVISYAALGPEQFFVISGFVILMTAWGRDVPHVVASRLARLYPAYWAAVLLTSFLLLVLWQDGKQITPTEVAVNLTMLQSLVDVRHVDGVYWTLWTELRFYVLIIALVAIGLTRRRILVVCAVWPPLAWLALYTRFEPFETLLVGAYAPFFAGGMLLYLMYRDGQAPLPWILLIGNVVFAVYQIVPRQFDTLSRNTGFVPSKVLIGVVVVLCFATVALLALTPLRSRGGAWMVTVGALTYPLYLIHEFWGWWIISLAHPELNRWASVAVAAIFAVGLATLIHHTVERPFGPRFRSWLVQLMEREARPRERPSRADNRSRPRAEAAPQLETSPTDPPPPA
jgi:peptidoglycan/LPS O-acetylase OafA/YrhL